MRNQTAKTDIPWVVHKFGGTSVANAERYCNRPACSLFGKPLRIA